MAAVAIVLVAVAFWAVLHCNRHWSWRYRLVDDRWEGRLTSLVLFVVGGLLTAAVVWSGWDDDGFPHAWHSQTWGNPWLAALFCWQFAAQGAIWVWVEGMRVFLACLPRHYRPRRVLAQDKARGVTAAHGIAERLLFTLVAIPVLQPRVLPSNGEQNLPDATAVSILVAAAALYVGMRVRCRDVEDPRLTIYALWGMLVSVGLGLFGGWVFWAVG